MTTYLRPVLTAFLFSLFVFGIPNESEAKTKKKERETQTQERDKSPDVNERSESVKRNNPDEKFDPRKRETSTREELLRGEQTNRDRKTEKGELENQRNPEFTREQNSDPKEDIETPEKRKDKPTSNESRSEKAQIPDPAALAEQLRKKS